MKKPGCYLFAVVVAILLVVIFTAPVRADGKRFYLKIRNDQSEREIEPTTPLKYPTKIMKRYEYCVDSSSRNAFYSYIAPTQQAIIAYKNGQETLIIEVAPLADPDFAWVVPVPAYPEVEKADPEIFVQLSNRTFFYLFSSFKFLSYESAQGIMTGDGSAVPDEQPEPVPSPTVTVHERKVVGAFDTAILSAEHPDVLVKWLNDNNYYFPEYGRDAVDFYVQRKWYFVAMKIANPEKLPKLHPVSFKFATSQPVYPMRLTALESGNSRVNLYVFADTEMGLKGGYRIWYGKPEELVNVDDQESIEVFKKRDMSNREAEQFIQGVRHELARGNKERRELREKLLSTVQAYPPQLTVINFEMKNHTIKDDVYLKKMHTNVRQVKLYEKSLSIASVMTFTFFIYLAIIDPTRWSRRHKKDNQKNIPEMNTNEQPESVSTGENAGGLSKVSEDYSQQNTIRSNSKEIEGQSLPRFIKAIHYTRRLLLSLGLAIIIIYFPAYTFFKFMEKNVDKQCLERCWSNMKTVGTALEIYSTDNSGHYPDSLNKLVPAYIEEIPSCPCAKGEMYSSTYQWGVKPDAYSFYCYYRHPMEGQNENLVVFPPCGVNKVVFDNCKWDDRISIVMDRWEQRENEK